jgi:hypothetical protein
MSIEVYRLTGRGEELAHSYRSPRTPEWAVIHFLYKRGSATRDQIYEQVPSASSSTLAKLSIKGIISSGRMVSI